MLVPFNYNINEDDNAVFTFTFLPSKPIEHIDRAYQTSIIIDELNDNLLLNCKCSCDGNRKYLKECKHIKEAKELLKEFKVSFREEVNNEQKTRTDREE